MSIQKIIIINTHINFIGGVRITSKMPFNCPACAQTMVVTSLCCDHCGTEIRGRFAASGLDRLTSDQLAFVETFVRCRGNLKEVERELRISYPTIRTRLDQIVQDMGYGLPAEHSDQNAVAVLDALSEGDLTFEEALQKLRGEDAP